MYYIYEIPGLKIGCTRKDQFEARQDKQKDKGQMIILEQHEDIMIASEREYELQKEKGYRLDPRRYYETVALSSLGGKACVVKLVNDPRRINAAREAAKVQITCPHCGKTGSKVGMPRYHFDRCKEKS